MKVNCNICGGKTNYIQTVSTELKPIAVIRLQVNIYECQNCGMLSTNIPTLDTSAIVRLGQIIADYLPDEITSDFDMQSGEGTNVEIFGKQFWIVLDEDDLVKLIRLAFDAPTYKIDNLLDSLGDDNEHK